MIKELKFSVVIVTFNRLNLLKECLTHVLKQSYSVKEIIVVNNNSTDGTKEFVEKLSEDVDFLIPINLENNVGGAGGFYEGVKNVSVEMDYVLLIDDDAILDYTYIEEIVNQIDSNILAYSGTVKTKGEIITSQRRMLVNNTLIKTKDVPEDEYKKEYFYYDIASFCGLVIANSLIKQIGLPKKEYFIWNDDLEYSLRIIEHTTIKNVNSAVLNHKTIIERPNCLTWKNYYSYRNKIDLGRKHSKQVKVFLGYRYTAHFTKMILCGLKAIFCEHNKSYWRNCFNLHKQVIKDSWNHKLGVSNVFYPGRKM